MYLGEQAAQHYIEAVIAVHKGNDRCFTHPDITQQLGDLPVLIYFQALFENVDRLLAVSAVQVNPSSAR